MATLAGPESEVAWYGTFGQILLPGIITGVLLGVVARVPIPAWAFAAAAFGLR